MFYFDVANIIIFFSVSQIKTMLFYYILFKLLIFNQKNLLLEKFWYIKEKYYFCSMELRLKELAKSKGITFQEIAKEMGITYQSFNKRLNACKLDTLKDIARILNCEVVELLEVNPPFSHSYSPEGEWKGISR